MTSTEKEPTVSIPRYEEPGDNNADDEYDDAPPQETTIVSDPTTRPQERRRARQQSEWAQVMQSNLVEAQKLHEGTPSVEFPIEMIAALRTNLLADMLFGEMPADPDVDERIPSQRVEFELRFEKAMQEQLLKAKEAVKEAQAQAKLVKPSNGDGLILPK